MVSIHKYGHWPTSLEAEGDTIAFLATTSLTPLGFFLLQSKIDLIIGEEGKILARGENSEVFDYGEEGWQTPEGHKHSARQWLGIDED